jgi:uncharacterized protein (DUF169 family)
MMDTVCADITLKNVGDITSVLVAGAVSLPQDTQKNVDIHKNPTYNFRHMNHLLFEEELGLVGKVISIKRTNEGTPFSPVSSGCVIAGLERVLDGETLVLGAENVLTCPGASDGFGFSDAAKYDEASIGAMLKCSPDVAYQKQLKRAVGVLEGFSKIEIKPYAEGDEPDVVAFFVNPDQLTALIMFFEYRATGYDTVLSPFSSICGSICRIPFTELRSEKPRAIVGTIDFGRTKFPENRMTFTVPFASFKEMREDAEAFFAKKFVWTGLKKRIQSPELS